MKRLLFSALLLLPSLSWADLPLKGRRIVLDPGHGTLHFDGNAINTGKTSHRGIKEFELNFRIAQKLGEALKKKGATVFFTRTPHDYWRISYSAAEDNRNRAYWANSINAEAYISIHCDWAKRSKTKGATVYYWKEESSELAQIIHNRLKLNGPMFGHRPLRAEFTVLERSEIPAVLVEMGFLSNRSESKKLNGPTYQKKLAHVMAEAITDFLKKKNA